jgi:hypothetical protein
MNGDHLFRVRVINNTAINKMPGGPIKINMHKVCVLGLVCFSFFVVFSALKNPAHNWDMIAYAGAAKSFEIRDHQALHEYVYSSLKSTVPAPTYERLISGDYRKAMSEDPEAFYKQIPFYDIKILYVFIVFLLAKAGLNIFTATYLVSSVSVVAAMWIIFLAFRKHILPAFFILFLFSTLLFRIVWIAQLSTPDGLALLAFMSVICALFKGKRVMFAILPLSILVRTDLILFSGLVLAYVFIKFPKWRAAAVWSFAASCFIYLFINRYFGNYGWNVLMNFTFVEIAPNPTKIQNQIHFADYLNILTGQIKRLFHVKQWLLYALITPVSIGGVFAFGKRQPNNPDSRKILYVLMISAGYAVIHFLLFPAVSTRFFIAPYVCGLLGFIYLLQNLFASGKKDIPSDLP